MAFSYALVDTTGTILPGDLAHMVEAGNWLAAQLSNAWGLTTISGSAYSKVDYDSKSIPKVDLQLRFVADDANVPGALGFHDEQSDAPYAELLINPVISNGGGVLDGGSSNCSLASVFFHELAESVCDLYCNSWVLMPNGTFLAFEVADPVEGNLVAVQCADGTVVQLSDFVYPRYFDAQAAPTTFSSTQDQPKFSYLGTIAAPLTMTAGGYQIIFDPSKYNDPNGPVSNVFGDLMPQWKRDLKASKARNRLRMSQYKMPQGVLVPRPPVTKPDLSTAAKMFMTDSEAAEAEKKSE